MDASVTGSALTASVVICAFTERRWADLSAAVESLARQSRAPDEIVIVIDHNPDLLARARRQFASSRVVANGHLYLRDQEFIFCYDVKDHGAGAQ